MKERIDTLQQQLAHYEQIKRFTLLPHHFSMENGELALGRNLHVAYMPWNGYNFEDAIILNADIVEKEYFTHVSIAEYTMDVRETKL